MNKLRLFFRILCLAVLGLAIAEIVWVRPSSGDESKKQSVSSGELAEELESKKLALENRSKEVEDQEKRLKDREAELDKKIKEMERLRLSVSGEFEQQKKNNEEKVVRLVSIMESMTPKSAAGVMDSLDDGLAVDVIKRMDVKKVAKIMNLLDKNRSAKLSELSTGYYNPEKSASNKNTNTERTPASNALKSNSVGQAAAPAVGGAQNQKNQKKGGEK